MLCCSHQTYTWLVIAELCPAIPRQCIRQCCTQCTYHACALKLFSGVCTNVAVLHCPEFEGITAWSCAGETCNRIAVGSCVTQFARRFAAILDWATQPTLESTYKCRNEWLDGWTDGCMDCMLIYWHSSFSRSYTGIAASPLALLHCRTGCFHMSWTS